MRIFGAIILGLLGSLSIAFALLGFFAHSLVDSAWMHLIGASSAIGGETARAAMEAGSRNVSLWPSVLLTLFGLIAFASAFLLVASGGKSHRVPRTRPLSRHSPVSYSSSLPRTPIKRRPRR